MSDIQLFHFRGDGVTQLPATTAALEKTLQNRIEEHLTVLLGVFFLASEHSTGKKHRGRIDTLGIDENGSPVIIEYKRSLNENVINQGLYYLDWLMDHKAAFREMVEKVRSKSEIDEKIPVDVDWSSPRLLCIAGGFTKYDIHAVTQIDRNIELIQYAEYGKDMLMLNLVNRTETHAPTPVATPRDRAPLKDLSDVLVPVWEDLSSFLLSLADDVTLKETKTYVAFKRIRNFACVHATTSVLVLSVSLEPTDDILKEKITKDMRGKGHLGTGDLEIRIATKVHLEKAKPLLVKAFEGN